VNTEAQAPPSANGVHTDAAAAHEQRLCDGQDCLAAALDYERLGWSVLALCHPSHVGFGRGHVRGCQTPGKRPWHAWKERMEPGRRATAEDLADLWRRQPCSNVGIALGPGSGLVRVDVDGPAGEARLQEHSAGDLPPTLEFVGDPAKGGRGLLYAIPPGAELRTTSEAPKAGEELRLQAKGAQTVLPPSRHPSGARYAWKPGHSPEDFDPAPAPAWLLEALRADQADRNGHAQEDNSQADPEVGELRLDPEAEPPADRLAALLKKSGRFAKTWRRERPDLKDQSCTAYEMGLAVHAALNEWADQEIADLLVAFRREHGEEGKRQPKHPGYYRQTIGRAFAKAAEVNARRQAQPSANGVASGEGKHVGGKPPAARPDDSEDPAHLTDRGNGIRLARRFGEDLRHCFPWRKWLVGDGTRWRPDDSGATTRRLKKVLVEMFQEALREVEEICEQLKAMAEEGEEEG
jgi:hypothetical protein